MGDSEARFVSHRCQYVTGRTSRKTRRYGVTTGLCYLEHGGRKSRRQPLSVPGNEERQRRVKVSLKIEFEAVPFLL